MRFGILGPLDIRSDDDSDGEGTALDPGGPRPRALLALLVLDAGRVVGTDRLTDGLYGDEPPAGAANALQSQVSWLRKRLGVRIESLPAGYRLVADPDDVDAHRFERLSGEGRRALTVGDHRRAAGLLREALGLWRGPALADLVSVPFAAAQAVRLDELRLAASQDRAEADLALGGGAELVPELLGLIAVHPLRERPYGQLMRALHAAGRPAEALAVYEDARRTLADELGADPSPELSALHLELLRGESPPPATARGVPAQLTSFVGRAQELEWVGALLAAGRLVTLTGPGGAGKTRLAVEAAGRWAGPVCYVELAPLDDAAQLPYAVLSALGVRESGFQDRAGDATERLLAALEGRELLLLLDNCEHVIDGTARFAALLLGACPGVRVLATSREALGITGEALCPLPPLAPEGAVALFTDRASAVRTGFGEGGDELHARVELICAALDGLPLAIELGAARLRTLTLDEIAARLDDRFRLLSRGDRTKAPRHRTLRAVVEWSWELLDEEERLLARRLTVFRGGATLDAVARVCGVADADDVLTSLTEKSFVEVTDGRYRMLDTIRAFCAERLTDEDHALSASHAGYFLELAEEAEPFLRSGAQLAWLARLEAEHADPQRAGAMLVFASERLDYDRHDTAVQKKILAERFAGMGWETPTILAALASTDTLYFDAIAQARVERLYKGRVVLLGDAGHGATMGGMGTGSAIVCAYVLAGELALVGGDHRVAFAAYEAEVTDFAKGCQKTAEGAGPFMAPATEKKMRQRDRAYRILSSRLLAGVFKQLTEKAASAITLKDYS